MFFRYNLPTLLWATVILLLTLLPAASMPEVPAWELISFHTASHAAVFFLLAVLMLRGFNKQTAYPFLNRYPVILTFLISVSFGALIEYLQTAMGWGRQGDIMDIVSNSIGTVLGIVGYLLLRRRRLPGNLL